MKLVLDSSTSVAKKRDNMILTAFKRQQIYAIRKDSVSTALCASSQKWATGANKAYF
jgi:hypothetical protein